MGAACRITHERILDAVPNLALLDHSGILTETGAAELPRTASPSGPIRWFHVLASSPLTPFSGPDKFVVLGAG